MTYDEVKALARRVGFDTENETGMTCLELFAMDVAKTEREARAQIVDVKQGVEAWEIHGGQETIDVLRDMAAAIRARSNAKSTP